MPDYSYDHIHLVSPEPEKTARFYQTMFGARLVDTRKLTDGRTTIELDLNGSRVLIIDKKPRSEAPPTPAKGLYGLEHFGILTDNLETAMAELKAKGAEFTEEIRDVRPGVRVSFLLGPDNVMIEMLERR